MRFGSSAFFKNIIITIFILAATASNRQGALMAQGFMGFHSDNYSGVHSLQWNPALLVDNRLAFQMNLSSSHFTVTNNYIGINAPSFLGDIEGAVNNPNFVDDFLVERLNGKEKNGLVRANYTLPLSFMVSFGKKKKQSLGFYSAIRSHASIDGFDEDLARMVYNELSIDELLNQSIVSQDISIDAGAWEEYGLSYGRQVFDNGKHFISSAATLKITRGRSAAYLYSDNLDVTFPSDSTISITNSDIRFGYADLFSNIDAFEPGAGFQNVSSFFQNGVSVGMDLGFVYEWRPNIEDYRYTLDGDTSYFRPDRNKYKLRLGVSIMDIGNTRYSRSDYLQGNGGLESIYADAPNVLIDDFAVAINRFQNDGLDGLSDSLSSIYVVTDEGSETFTMTLPFRINAFADYAMGKNFYTNFSMSIAPAFRKNPEKSRDISEFSLTPRYENHWFGFYLPVSINTNGNAHLGAGMRFGPLVVGTNDFTPLFRETTYDANFYAALNIPIRKRLRDKDRDHVSNSVDECRRVPGSWEGLGCPDLDKDGLNDDVDECPRDSGLLALNGCPDLDGDGIANHLDSCIDVYGLIELDGCPDTDLDGITDAEDNCPEVAGSREMNGCPDQDFDGITDAEDVCPTRFGMLIYNGCPDSDNDSIPDPQDSCAFAAGPIENNGCPYGDADGDGLNDGEDACPETFGPADNLGCPYPDSDGDGVNDPADDCPEIFGPMDNKGCPYPDTDGDGLNDMEDECPKTFGLIELQGCPKVEEEVKEVLDTAFNNLSFNTGNAIILEESYASLEKLVEVLSADSTFKLRIEGHTDDVGTESMNTILSQNRAQAVANYLIEKGIEETRLEVEGYGETKPVVPNDSPENRAINRRVELTIFFE
ncbi:MAG: DUF5723 family protein [Bacteroidota bacterium]|nr:DUF5723 family protein [Bacteroidota bacterium]MEC8756821.1 DUF5723 family protein [Bacteroidota bacterium]